MKNLETLATVIAGTVIPSRQSPAAILTKKVLARWLCLGLCLGLLCRAEAEVLKNIYVRAEFDGRGLTNLTDLATGKSFPFSQDDCSASVGGDTFLSSECAAPLVRQTTTNRVYQFSSGQWTFEVRYELEPEWRFLSKQIVISTAVTTNFVVRQVEVMRGSLAAQAAAQQPVNSGWLLRFNDGAGTPVSHGLFLNLQCPPQYMRALVSGRQVTVSYSPELEWNRSWGGFVSDRLLMGPYQLSGVGYAALMVKPWRYVPEGVPPGGDDLAYSTPGCTQWRFAPEGAPTGGTIDRAELDALTGCVRAFLFRQPTNSTRVHVSWCENDYQADVKTTAGLAEYHRILDQAAAVGCKNVIYTPVNSLLSDIAADTDSWHWEHVLWLGLGQQIRTNAWYPGSNAVPASVRSMFDYARSRDLKLLAYAYPSLPFKQEPRWTERSATADSGQRSFQDWWLRLLGDFKNATGIAGYSFDYWYLENKDAFSSCYAQWYGCRRIQEELRSRFPDIVMDARAWYQHFGVWTYLASTYACPVMDDEQPQNIATFPDLHFDRVEADYQRWCAWWYRVQNLCPTELVPGFISHQTARETRSGVVTNAFRTRDWDYLGWRYSVISSVATAPFNHVVDYLPARDTNEFNAFCDADKLWLRHWLDWTDQNLEVLRHVHPILNQPQLGRVDGTAAFKDGRGFVFLFNPNYRPLAARLRLDASVGLDQGGPFVLRQLYPDAEKGKLILPPQGGVWNLGDELAVQMPGADALVLEVSKAPLATAPILLGARGAAEFKAGQLVLTNVVGQAGRQSELRVLLPNGEPATRVVVNGREIPFEQRDNLVSMKVVFAGKAFDRLQQIGAYDPGFKGGVFSAQIAVPKSVFDQLEARKAAWPIPYTDDDLLAPWLGSQRLLLFVNIAEPTPGMSVSLRIDGQSVPLKAAYTTIYDLKCDRSLTGWYADLSSLTPDVQHRFELDLPNLSAGQFQGLFLDNVEAQFTESVQGNSL